MKQENSTGLWQIKNVHGSQDITDIIGTRKDKVLYQISTVAMYNTSYIHIRHSARNPLK